MSKQIVMKKGSSLINVNSSRKLHYEKLGYEVLKEENKREKKATETKMVMP